MAREESGVVRVGLRWREAVGKRGTDGRSHKGSFVAHTLDILQRSDSDNSNLLLQWLWIATMDLLVSVQFLARPRYICPRSCQRGSWGTNIAVFLQRKISVGSGSVESLNGLFQGFREAKLLRARLLHSRTLACAGLPSAELVPMQFRMPLAFVKAFKQAALDRDMKLNELLNVCFDVFMKTTKG